MKLRYDIAVVGAGLAGACIAALLARHAGLAPDRIVLVGDGLEAGGDAEAAPDPRVVAISRASEHVLQAAGAWSRLDPSRLCAYERMRVWHESSSANAATALCFDAADIGEPNLGRIAENRALLHACIESFRAAGGVVLSTGLSALTFRPEAAELVCGDGSTFSVRLVVGADGARSMVRACAGLVVHGRDYRQVGIVATLHTARPHEHTAWQRFLRSGPLALLPLPDGSSSLVWSTDQAQAARLRECSETQFCEQVELASDLVLGTCRLQSQRLGFALRSLRSQSYVVPRCALIGDAAHVIHPLAGQGANLGMLDAAALCEAVARALREREDPGALRILRGFEQQRRTHNLVMNAAMGAFQGGFSAARGPAAWLASQALGIANRSGPLKRALARQALGLSGELPPLARALH
jgi:2-octaprenylphenol hydroxylase